METIKAPFTPIQVRNLNIYQNSSRVHPFTCVNNHEPNNNLFATEEGWVCPYCDYTQDWAHKFMTEFEEMQNNLDYFKK